VARAGRLRVAILGFGGGTYARQLLHFLSDRCELSIVGVELDPDVVGIARSELGLPDDPRLRIEVDLDARTFVDHSTEQFDVVLVDCYHRQSFLPPHVTSREFFASARNRLVPSGVLAINLFGYGARDPVVESVLATMQAGVGTRPVMCSLPRTANFLVYASRDGVPRLPQDWAMGGWPEECRDLGARLATPAQSFLHTAVEGATVFTDQGRDVDRLQVERLRRHAESLLEGAR
jgi:spermidine synthase